MIRVAWSPDSCSMDSCININKLSDPDIDAQDRATTNDETHCVLIPTSGNVVAMQLERICGCIADHLHLVSGQQLKVGKMVLVFKIDYGDRVWLLWCEQMEINDDVRSVLKFLLMFSFKYSKCNFRLFPRNQEGNPIRKGLDSQDEMKLRPNLNLSSDLDQATSLGDRNRFLESDNIVEKGELPDSVMFAEDESDASEDYISNRKATDPVLASRGSSREDTDEDEVTFLYNTSSASEGNQGPDHMPFEEDFSQRRTKKETVKPLRKPQRSLESVRDLRSEGTNSSPRGAKKKRC